MLTKHFFYCCFLLFGALLLGSCDKSESDTENQTQEVVGSVKYLALSDTQRETIAQQLALSMALNPGSFTELNNAIDVIYEYGVDEFIYVYDILHPNLSRFINATLNISNLSAAIQNSNIIVNCGVSQIQYYDNLQLYWPYHDDWDGMTTPIIVFEPAISNATTTVNGYKLVGNTIVEVSIKVADMDHDNNSYVIIREADFPYTIYPSFVDGEFTNNGVTWIRRSNVYDEEGNLCYVNETNGTDTLVEASLISFKSNGDQYDSWLFGGGSEFVFATAYATIDGISHTNLFRLDMTRKEIKNCTTKVLDAIVCPEWDKDCKDLYFRLWEEDAAGTPGTLSIKLSYKSDSISATLNIKSTDDLIASGYWNRNSYINSCLTGDNNHSLSNNKIWKKIRLYSSVSF